MAGEQAIKIRSSITPELLRLTLRRGGLFGVAGAVIIVVTGTFLPVDQLKIWGVPVFFAGLALIAIGLLPYRQLTRLQMKPHELVYDGETLLFLQQGKPLMEVPISSIETVKYVEKDHLYGLALWLKEPVVDKVKVLQKRFNFEGFMQDSAVRFEGCSLFFPYFTKRSAGSIQDLLTDNPT